MPSSCQYDQISSRKQGLRQLLLQDAVAQLQPLVLVVAGPFRRGHVAELPSDDGQVRKRVVDLVARVRRLVVVSDLSAVLAATPGRCSSLPSVR